MENIFKKMLLQKYQRHIIEMHQKHLYSVGMSTIIGERIYNTKSVLELHKLINECIKCDKEFPVSFGAGLEIERLVESEDTTVGFYQASFKENELQSSKVNRILNNGVQVTNYTFDSPHLERSLYFPDDIIEAMDALKTDIKDSKIVFILKFPKEFVEEDGGYSSFNDVFKADKDGVYIKPDFVDSYVVSSQGSMSKIKRPEVKKLLIKKINK